MILARGILWFAWIAVCAGLGIARAHEEWNRYHIVYSALSSFTYPFDGRTPKIAAALLYHYPTPGPATVFTFTVNGQRPAGRGFATFPDGGSIVADADGYGIASALTAGVYDGQNGRAPAVGEALEQTFQFVFALAPGATPPPGTTVSTNPDPNNNNDLPGITTAKVRFTNLGETPALSGPLAISGALRVPPATGAPTVVNARIEVSTPWSNWFPMATTETATPGARVFTFAQALPARGDWHVRFSADGYETRIVPVGFINDPRGPMDVTLEPAPRPNIDFRRLAAIATPTGFWRGAVSESEGTFVAFPGQETWRAAASEAEARTQRMASRIFKYTFDGRLVWFHSPGWETWAGDMTRDGRFVAYALNPTAHSG